MQYSKDIPLQWYEKYLLHAGCLPLLKMNVNIINWIEMSMKKIFYFEKIIISLACLPKIEIKSRMMLIHQCAFLIFQIDASTYPVGTVLPVCSKYPDSLAAIANCSFSLHVLTMISFSPRWYPGILTVNTENGSPSSVVPMIAIALPDR
jgi:hypothetical protein